MTLCEITCKCAHEFQQHWIGLLLSRLSLFGTLGHECYRRACRRSKPRAILAGTGEKPGDIILAVPKPAI